MAQARQQQEHLYTDPQESPLVSVIIPTWNRARLLVERTLPSVLAQSYQNFEVIVVGDHCTDETEDMIKQLGSPKVRFYNLPERGNYPEEEWARWRVAGAKPINHAFGIARGKWIAPLDDDDVFTPDHIEVLLRHAQNNNLEFAYGKQKRQITPEEWVDRGQPPFSSRICQNSATIYRSYLKLFRFDINAWRVEWPVDKHRIWRMYKAGVRADFLDRVVCLSPLRPGQTLLGPKAEDRPDNQISPPISKQTALRRFPLSSQKIRAFLRESLLKTLSKLPDGVILAIRGKLSLHRRLDYARHVIYLDIQSPDEYFVRLQSCAKEPETVEWIETFIREGDVVYDIGANIGAYSLVASRFTDGKATVYAFEPGFANYSQLCRNTFLNHCQSSVIPIQIALSDKTGLGVFGYSNLDPGSASHTFDRQAEGNGQLLQQVLSYRLDDLVQQFGIKRANHIKIDVDGCELEVLSGGRSVLRSPSLRTLLVEIDEALPGKDEIFQILEDSGFQEHSRHRHPAVSNYIFVRRAQSK